RTSGGWKGSGRPSARSSKCSACPASPPPWGRSRSRVDRGDVGRRIEERDVPLLDLTRRSEGVQGRLEQERHLEPLESRRQGGEVRAGAGGCRDVDEFGRVPAGAG